MNLEDIMQQLPLAKFADWQLGSLLSREPEAGGIALLFCADYRGAGGATVAEPKFDRVRQELYSLSRLDFELPLCDLGDLRPGNTLEDTRFALAEVLALCLKKHMLPILIGGSNDLAYTLFESLNDGEENISYTQISNVISLAAAGEEVREDNFLTRIFSSKKFHLKNYHHLGYQTHLNAMDSVRLMKDVDFDVLRLADMMNSTEKAEPFLRRAHLITLNCDAVESYGDGFSFKPQVNGLNRREVCAYMKESGLSENLKAAGIFNFNAESRTLLNHQLLAQMIWYLIEGINIRSTHPTTSSFETYWVIIDDDQYAFQRDIFTNLWYFGDSENAEELIPCGRWDFEEAKRGFLNPRFRK